MIAQWTPLAYSRCRRFRSCSLDPADLHQEALHALVRAVDAFDPSRGPFLPFAAASISNALQALAAAQMRPVRVPSYLNKIAGRVSRAREVLMCAGDGNPSVEEVAALAGTTPARVRRSDAAWWNRVDADLDAFALTEPDADESEDWTYRESLVRMVEASLDALSGRQRDMVVRFFGLDGDEPLSCVAIAREDHVTREAVRACLNRALDAIRADFHTRGWTVDTWALAIA